MSAVEVTFYEDYKMSSIDWPDGCDHAYLFKAGMNYKIPAEYVAPLKEMGVCAPVGEEQPPKVTGKSIELPVLSQKLGQQSRSK